MERVLSLYRDRYFDLNVQHFHEKLGAGPEISLSYTWVKKALQGQDWRRRGASGECIASGGPWRA